MKHMPLTSDANACSLHFRLSGSALVLFTFASALNHELLGYVPLVKMALESREQHLEIHQSAYRLMDLRWVQEMSHDLDF